MSPFVHTGQDNLTNSLLSQGQMDRLIEEKGNCPDYTEQSVDWKCDDTNQDPSFCIEPEPICDTLIEHQPRGDTGQEQPRTDDIVQRLCWFRDWEAVFFKIRKIRRVILFFGLGHRYKISQQTSNQQTAHD